MKQATYGLLQYGRMKGVLMDKAKGITNQNKMIMDEYLGLKGFDSPFSDYMLDKLRIPHGLTQRQQKKLEKDADIHANQYSENRKKAKAEYKKLVQEGIIIPKTREERLIQTARFGHPDNDATKAARRACEKRGIDWR